MLIEFPAQGDPLDGFEDFEDYLWAVARGAKLKCMCDDMDFFPDITILYKDYKQRYISYANSILEWRDDIKEVANMINEPFTAFTAAFRVKDERDIVLHIVGLSAEASQALWVRSLLNKQDGLHMSDVEIENINKDYKPLTDLLTHPAKDDLLRNNRKSNGVCLHCGGNFKGRFVKKCVTCGRKKNY